MLLQFIHIILVSAIAITWGIPIVLASSSSIVRDQFWWRSFPAFLSFLFFCGCLLISFISSWLCLFIPLQFHYLIVLTVFLIFYLFLFQRKKISDLFGQQIRLQRKLSLIQLLFIFSSLCLFLCLSTLKPVHWDTQFYHLQLIRWQSEYGVVPGIANLYPRLGLGSNWFNLISFFYYPGVKTENFTYVNASLVIWVFLWLFSTWQYHFQQFQTNKNSRALTIFYFIILLFSIFDWQIFRDAANSTNYDFVVNSFTFIIFAYFIEAAFNNRLPQYFSIVVLIFALSIISFKFSGIFIVSLILYHLIAARKMTNWLVTIAAGLLILVPVFIKNYIATGYPLFPATISFNTPDWQFPKDMAERFYRYIILSNKFYNSQWSFIDSFHHTTFNWIPFWLNGILWKHKFIIILAVLSGSFLFIKAKLPINHKALRWLIIIIFFMMAGWFFTAPDPGRFGYGVLLPAASLTISLITYRFIQARLFNPILLLTTIIIGYYTLKKSEQLIKDTSSLIFPIPSDQPSYQTLNKKGIHFHLPEILNENWDHRCYFTPLPCITQENPYLQPRGIKIKDGFRMSPYPDSGFIKNYEY